MAKIKRNIVTEGLSGMIGDQLVFRQLNNETIVSAKPVHTKDPSAAQIDNRKAFAARQIWARSHKNDPVYVAASSAKKAKFPGGFHAAMHDAATPPALQTGRHFKDGNMVYGAGQVYGIDNSEAYIEEIFAAGLSVASLTAEIAEVTENPSGQAAGHSFTFANAFEPVGAGNINYVASPDGSGQNTWQVNIQQEMIDQAWAQTAGNYLVLKITMTDNYGNSFSLDPTNMTAETLTTFGEALSYLVSMQDILA